MKTNNRDCKIVQDLLPNYIENLTDEITNEYLKELEVEYIVSGKPLVNTEWVLCKKSGNYFIYEAKGHKKHYIIG